jgi:hypothetical protein
MPELSERHEVTLRGRDARKRSPRAIELRLQRLGVLPTETLRRPPHVRARAPRTSRGFRLQAEE